MKLILFKSTFVIAPFVIFWGCKKAASPSPGEKTTSSVVSLISGAHTWHGYQTFDGKEDTINGYAMTIIPINDSVIATSNLPQLQLPYYATDSINHLVIFWQHNDPPPKLTFNYLTGELHYSEYMSGVHISDMEIYSP